MELNKTKNTIKIKKQIFLILIVLLSSCNRVEKAVNEVKALQQIQITYDDYEVEIDQYKRSIYVDQNRDFMTGHYFVMYNKKVSEEFIVKGGLLDGYHRTYNPEGYLSQEHTYKSGYLHGTKKSFNNKGQVISSSNYEKGKRVGDEVSFTEDGKILTKTETINGKTYQHTYKNDKRKMTTYIDKIDGKAYTIMLHFNEVEVLNGAFAIKENNTDSDIPSKFYVLNDQYKIVDSISPQEEPQRMQQILYLLQQ